MIENTARPYSNLCYRTVRFGIFSCVIPAFFLYSNRLKFTMACIVLLLVARMPMEIPVDIIIFLRFHKMLKM